MIVWKGSCHKERKGVKASLIGGGNILAHKEDGSPVVVIKTESNLLKLK